MDDFGNLAIPGAHDWPYTLYMTLDERMTQEISADPYGGFGVEGFALYDL